MFKKSFFKNPEQKPQTQENIKENKTVTINLTLNLSIQKEQFDKVMDILENYTPKSQPEPEQDNHYENYIKERNDIKKKKQRRNSMYSRIEESDWDNAPINQNWRDFGF